MKDTRHTEIFKLKQLLETAGITHAFRDECSFTQERYVIVVPVGDGAGELEFRQGDYTISNRAGYMEMFAENAGMPNEIRGWIDAETAMVHVKARAIGAFPANPKR